MKRKDFIKLATIAPMTGLGLKTLAKMAENWNEGEKMPALFVGHGNPMHAISENEITKGWRNMTQGLQPKAILCVSAHWETRGTQVTMAPKPETIHDFSGFPQQLFDVQYPAPGAPEMAKEVIENVSSFSVREDHEWGLDHGTWSVLIKMFPTADVPVFQLSLDYQIRPADHYALAKELAFLRERGVLIVGSGNIIHNLGRARWNSNEPYDWALQFDETTKQLISARDHERLINYSRLGQEARLSIPTAEHYLPLLYILGLQDKNDNLQYFNEMIDMGSMAMRSFVIG